MLSNILIRNVSVFDACSGVFSPGQDIRVTNGVVAEMRPGILPMPGWEVVEAEGLCASAGWIDCHTHLESFDPFLSYPGLGATRVHEAGSYGAFTYERIHNVISKLPFPVTSYLYVGCWGVVGNGHDELLTLDNLKPEAFCEVSSQYPGEIIGAKIRIDPRVNCDTKKTLRMAKEVAQRAGLPLIVHPSRCRDSLEEILDVMEKDDVYAHTYSAVAPTLFDGDGRVKQCAWDAMKRGVRFDLSHGSNNFSYDIARRAIAQGFVVETISTDLHEKNYTRPGISLAGVMTKAIHAGIPVEDALKKVIVAPAKLLGLPEEPRGIQEGKPADMTLFRVEKKACELPDSQGVAETCRTQVEVVATVIGASVHRAQPQACLGSNYWPALSE